MIEKEYLYDKYSDLRINRIHMYPNQEGTSLFFDSGLEHEVPYDEVVNAVVMGFIGIKSDGSVYTPTKYTLTDEGITLYCDDDIEIEVSAPVETESDPEPDPDPDPDPDPESESESNEPGE